MPQQTLDREQPTVTRGKDDYAPDTVTAYGHTAEITRGHHLVRINAPSFYQDLDFKRWLNSEKDGPATWHRPRGTEPGEYSDIFIHYGGASWDDKHGFSAEGSDYPSSTERPGIPQPIYALIAEAVREATGSMQNEALIWISNLS